MLVTCASAFYCHFMYSYCDSAEKSASSKTGHILPMAELLRIQYPAHEGFQVDSDVYQSNLDHTAVITPTQGCRLQVLRKPSDGSGISCCLQLPCAARARKLLVGDGINCTERRIFPEEKLGPS